METENTFKCTILGHAPTVGSAFHEKLIKRSEIAGFMGTSHKERIALNHNNVYRVSVQTNRQKKYTACCKL